MVLEVLFKTVLSLSFMGSILAGIIILTKRLFKNKLSANWHYYIWFLLIIRLAIPYSPESSLSIFNLLPSTSQRVEITQDVSVDKNVPFSPIKENLQVYRGTDTNTNNMQSESVEKGDMVEPKKDSFNLNFKIISIVWLIGAVLMLLYILILNCMFIKRVRKRICKEEEILRTFDECKLKMNVKATIPIIYDKNVKTSSLFGLVRPKLLISPEIINALSEEEKRYIFLHELAHLKRKDILVNWIMALVQVLHWFNPIVWYAFYKMREDCEVACDAYVLTRLNEVEHIKYGETIINLINTISKPYWNPVTTGMANNESSIKRRIKMITMFKKNSWKWSIIALAIMIVIGFTGLTGAKGVDGPNAGPIVVDELREVLPDVLEVTKTTSDYIDGQHIVWVEGRFKSTDKELYLTFLDDKGQQLDSGIREVDEIKPLKDGWFSFKHKLVETTGKITDTQNVTIIFHLKQDGKNIKGILTVPAKRPEGVSTEPKEKKDDNKNNQSSDTKGWEVISREDRVQGTIIKLDKTSDMLNSITLKATKRIILPNNPIDYDFSGKTFNIVFNEDLANAGILKDKLKEGAEIVVTLAQYAIPPDGKVVYGAYLKDIYYFENGKYYDIRGKEVKLVPAADEEFITKPQIEVPVDLEVEKFEQQQVDEGHKPWRLDPIQTTITFVSLKISPEGVEGPFPVKLEDLKVIQQTDKVATVEIGGDKTSVNRVYLKRLIRQDSTGIWSVVGYDLKTQQVKYNLPPFNGNVAKTELNKELKISAEKWLEVKRAFQEQHYPSNEVQDLKQSNFKSEEMWKGALNGKDFELAIYRNTPFQVLIVKYGDEERISLLQDFYYNPWVFYGESIRFQQMTKGVGLSYNIISGEFNKNNTENEIEIFDAIFNDLLQLQKNNSLVSGNEVEVGGNKARLLGGYSLIIK
jgi:beta-lactamase regulating signal transducer with metallopeptidase domain